MDDDDMADFGNPWNPVEADPFPGEAASGPFEADPFEAVDRSFERTFKRDPASIGQTAGAESRSVDLYSESPRPGAKVKDLPAAISMGHEMRYESVGQASMKLADGAAARFDGAAEARRRGEDKTRLMKTSWAFGNNGPAQDYVVESRMPEIRGDHRLAPIRRVSANAPFARDDAASCADWSTTMRECMTSGLTPKAAPKRFGKIAELDVDPKAMKRALASSSIGHVSRGDGVWHGGNKRLTTPPDASEARKNQLFAAAVVEGKLRAPGILDTLFPRASVEGAYSTMSKVMMPEARSQLDPLARRAGVVAKATVNDGPFSHTPKRA